MRLLNKFSQGTNESVMDSLYRWMFGQLSIDGITLDLDRPVTGHSKVPRVATTRPNAGGRATTR
jgi:hypothetical protein